MSAKLLDMPAADYHAEKIDGPPRLSASIAKTLLTKSPLHAWIQHPKLGGRNLLRESTTEQIRGTLIHALVLGTGLDECVRIDAENYRTKAAQELRDAAFRDGLTPVLSKDWNDAEKTAAEIVRKIEDAGLNLGGQSEAVATWTEDTAAGPIECRGMLDNVTVAEDYAAIIDLKTTKDASPKAIAATVQNYCYDVQRSAYVSAVEHIRPDLAGRIGFKWVFIEELPYGAPDRVILTVAEAAGTFRELGAARWKRACELWGACLKNNHWPSYGDAVLIEAPTWAVKEELEREIV